MQNTIRNIGILAHVDAGKTTITEGFLFLAGAITKAGNVNQGSTISDNLDIEKQRGVSVRAACISFGWKGHQINLIDTPGHADFSSEVERALEVLDGVILVISAVEGVQSHTHTLWELLTALKIPVIIFINKIDRQGSDFHAVLAELKNELKAHLFPFVSASHEGTNQATINKLFDGKYHQNAGTVELGYLDVLAGIDDEIFERYLEGEMLSDQTLIEKIKYQTAKALLFPVFAGVAKNCVGIDPLLDAIVDLLPQPETFAGDTLSALVFKVEHDKSLGRLAYVRVFSGKIKVRDTVWNHTRQNQAKIAMIRKFRTVKPEHVSELYSGDIGLISGLPDVRTFDVLGVPHGISFNSGLQVPVLTVNIKPGNSDQYAALAEALTILNIEDPKLDFRWYREAREMSLNVMGKIQMEVLESIIQSRFGIDVEFTDPTVIYKETPHASGFGFAGYTMPKPCWAVTRFKIEPGGRGSGIKYVSMVSVDKIHQKYQNEIEKIVPKALVQGIKGWEVTDIRVTLVDGEDHEIHSRPGDFNIATPMAIMQGLQKIGTSLLEPYLKFLMKFPESFLGKIAGDLHAMRAEFDPPKFIDGNAVVVEGLVPASASLDYGIRFSSLTGGKGKLRLQFAEYRECPDELGVVRSYKGVNPLDRSQWILHNRGAFKADDRRV
nr:TetM/TetW/TetO/TetS family tetracycline resistance ribosomal protection protein [Bacteroidota bacterium]